jgi:FlaA1/EpsC-like NDP-sugar epimerase
MGLYKSLWKYAGLHDMNRIVGASVVTCVIHILGTLLFVMRMPITYYALGAAFQFVLLTVSRFSYRLLLIERGKFFRKRKKETVNVMVVGTGESSRMVLKHFDRDPGSIVRPVCVIDFSNSEFQGTMAGVQVIRGIENLASAVRKYQVDRVLLADVAMPKEIREKVREICKELDLNTQDYSEYFQSTPSRIPLRTLLEYVEDSVWIEMDGKKTRYAAPEAALMAVRGKYIVDAVGTYEGQLCIGLIRDLLMPNDTQADWVRDYQKETGEDISFF